MTVLDYMKETQNIDRIYRSFIDKERQIDFYRGLKQYLDEIYSVDIFKNEFIKQLSHRANLYKEIEVKERKIREEIQKLKLFLVKFIKNNKISTSQFKRTYTFSMNGASDIFQDIEAYENGKIFSNSPFTSDSLMGFLFDIIENLSQLGFRNEMKSCINEIHPNHYKFLFADIFDERNLLVSEFENARAFDTWGSFEKLAQFKIALEYSANMKDMPKGIDNIDWFGSVKETLTIYEVAKEIRSLREKELPFYSKVNTSFETRRNETSKYLNSQDFKTATEIVHNQLIKVLPDDKATEVKKGNFKNNKTSETEVFGFTVSEAEILYDKKKLSLTPQAIRVLTYFLNTPDEFISYETLQEIAITNKRVTLKTLQKIISKIREAVPRKIRKDLIKSHANKGYIFYTKNIR